MAYAKSFVKFSFLYSIAATDEGAETSVNVSTIGSTPFDAALFLASLTDAELATVGDAYWTMVSTSGLDSAIFGDYNAVKAAAIGTDGHYLSDPKIHNFSPRSGSSATTQAQDSVVVSLRAPTNVGGGNRGRMYLPYTSGGHVAGAPNMDPALTAQLAARAVTFVRAVNTVANALVPSSGVVIMGRTGAGTVKSVAQVRVGDLVDTQRRRREQLAETYASGTV